MRWDIFCKIIDNYGDAGVCWRLCKSLLASPHSEASRRIEQIRLFCDDLEVLQELQDKVIENDPACTLEVLAWDQASAHHAQKVDVVIEAFACELPAAYVRHLRQDVVWLNLEYLSAEEFALSSHGMGSPQNSGQTKFFYFPGFLPASGGLIHGTPYIHRQGQHPLAKGSNYLAQFLEKLSPGSKKVSVFQYPSRDLSAWLMNLDQLCQSRGERVDLILCAGQKLDMALQHIDTHQLPMLSQYDYDILLQNCDLNLVRGEDSFVRAQLAGRPFIWDIYQQTDGVHLQKHAAFFALFSQYCPKPLLPALHALHHYELPEHWWQLLPELNQQAQSWARYLLEQTPLEVKIQDFVKTQENMR